MLVNNAGYGAYGTDRGGRPDEVRRQFETNVFGLARMTQLVLPGMRAAGRGRIVNVGSMGGRMVFPAGGYYHASKYAVEALTDALRFEAAPFGIKVSLVEPGLIRTEFGDTAARTLAGSAAPAGPYAALNQAAGQQMADSYGSRLLSAPPEAVAKVIERAVTGAAPPDSLRDHARRQDAGAQPTPAGRPRLRRLPAPAVQGSRITRIDRASPTPSIARTVRMSVRTRSGRVTASPALVAAALPEHCGVVAVPNSVFYDHPTAGRSQDRFAFRKREDVLTEAAQRLRKAFNG